jgi:hypothetical protein
MCVNCERDINSKIAVICQFQNRINLLKREDKLRVEYFQFNFICEMSSIERK